MDRFEFRPPILSAPDSPDAYDLDAPGAYVRIPPERFARLARWAEVAGADPTRTAMARGKIDRLASGRDARRAALTAPRGRLAIDVGGRRLVFAVDERVSRDFFARVLRRDDAGRFLDHEPAVLRTLNSRMRPGVLLVDIGAHVGYFSCFAAVLGATVLAVEMQPTLCDAISVNAAVNDLWRVHTLCAALGAEPGMAQLIRLNPQPGMQVQSEKVAAGWCPIDSLNHDMVAMLTVDQILSMPQAASVRDTLVKVDVEGAEALVLSGARRTIATGAATFVVEVHPQSLHTFGGSVADVVAAFPGDRWRHVLMQDAGDRELAADRTLGEIDAAKAGDPSGNVTVRFEPR